MTSAVDGQVITLNFLNMRNALILHDVDVAPLQVLSKFFHIIG